MRRYLYLLLSMFLLLPSCQDDFEGTEDGDHLIVEGWIASGEAPVVMLTTSVGYSTEWTSIDSLYQHVLNWGVVSVSDGEKTVFLTGMKNSAYFPPYIYTTIDMKGEVGKTYTLKASYHGMQATATTTVPAPVPIDSLTLQRAAHNDTCWIIQAHFTDPPGHQYYCFFDRVGLNSLQFVKSSMGVIDGNAVNADESGCKSINYPLYRTVGLVDAEGRTDNFYHTGDRVTMQLCTLDSLSFLFWNDFQNSTTMASNQFIPYTRNLRTNVVGGSGYWCGYGISRKSIIVK